MTSSEVHGHLHQQHGHGHGHDHAHGQAGADAGDEAALAELLDLDAEVLRDQLSDVTAWVDGLAGGLGARRILDLGCGTGTGTLALLRRAADAEVTSVDGSAYMLDRLREKARGLGVDARVRTVQADLDAPWPDFGAVDVVWASAFMHHLADPERGLRQLFAALRPGGLLAVIEMDGFPRFLPEVLDTGIDSDTGGGADSDTGAGTGTTGERPGLEERCHAALADVRGEQMPHLGADWGVLLTRAGFVVEQNRTFAIDLRPRDADHAAVGRYAQATLGRMRSRLEGLVSGEDLAALDLLLDTDRPESLTRRTDLVVRANRPAWAARRP